MPHKRAKRSVREQQAKERGADLAPPGTNSGTRIATERIPKSASRVLDAARIRAEYREKRARQRIKETDASGDLNALKPPPPKRRRLDAGAAGAEKSSKGKDHLPVIGAIEIQPGESLKHFNRRVEDSMRPLVRSAMLASAATERKERKVAAASVVIAPNASNNKVQQPSPSPVTRKFSKVHADHSPPLPLDTTDDDRPKEFATTSSAAPRRLNDIAMAPPELKKLPRGAAKRSASGKPKAGAGVLSMAQRAMMEVERENAIRRYREMKERKAMEGNQTPLQGEGQG